MSLVTIDIQRSTVISTDHTPARELTARIELVDPETGQKAFMSYVDPSTGEIVRPRVPCKIDTSTERGKRNLAYFEAYRDLHLPRLIIIDPDKVQKQEVNDRLARLKALNHIETLNGEKKYATMADILRRLEGPVAAFTAEQVYLRLSRIAETTPARINDLLVDPDFETKVKIDKAVEEKRLILKDARYYYLPERGVPVADGLERMVYVYHNDREVREYIDQAPIAEKPFQGKGKGKGKAPAKDYMQYAQPVETPGQTPAGLTLLSEERKLAEGEVESLVLRALSSGLINQEPDGYALPGGGRAATEAEVITFYKTNPRQAESLKAEADAYGI